MINTDAVNESIINPVVSNNALNEQVNLIDILKNKVIISNDISKTSDIDKLVEAIISGDTALLLEDFREALMINSKGWQSRGIVEPETEKVLRGPREGFTEAIMVNLSLIRRKLKTPDLKFQFKTIGKRTKTRACICYIDGIVNPQIIDELNTRLDKMDIDGVLDTGYIQELIRDSRFSPFRTIGTTERPDVIVGKMLEGRVALILDGTPIALTVPFIFVELFQSSDDYYNNYYFTSVSRIIRIISFLITVSVPALYLALITFHQELIPTDLLISISAARQGIPFPTIIEALSLLIVFEILRETGTRMPTYIGQALSIVGALVLGTAAVDARLVSAPMVIIIGLSGTAVFKKDKFVGFLDEKETKDFLFITDNVKRGLIIEKGLEENKKANITFEIFKSKTKVKPVYKNGEFTMDILIRPQVAIAEQGTTKDYIDKKGMKQIKTNAEKKMETDIEKLVKKVQEKYGADIFGFGRLIFHNKKKLWKGVKENWDEEFKNVNVKVKVELDIKNSALLRKPIKVGD